MKLKFKKYWNETLIVLDDQDRAYNFDQVKTLNDNISSSDLKIIKGCSHNAHMEKSGKFNEIIRLS